MKNLLIKLIRNEEDLLLKTVVTVTLVHLLIFTVIICLRIASEFGYFDYAAIKPFILSVASISSVLLIVLSCSLLYRIHKDEA
ncbi:hypothetical protein [Succinivibrio dextrinosolvens]|jgi:hypothetical protein|uniref:hypothetical protein n=1 Tax=Succinivibrio dextrinosolvens TaxID=83771 RepID=UPI00241D29C7|nr:hypothetical protein [Succinivibrio dextrinosolvens]MBE6422033.1 hypothetical protein [Succinivibrio dextrinosolvens]